MYQAVPSKLTSDQQAGFGLLEVVISAGILATVIGASVGLMNTSLRRASLASDRATAMNLAQEAIEISRAMRDTAYVDGVANEWTWYFCSPTSGVAPGNSCALSYQRENGTCCYWSMRKSGELSVIPGTTITDGVETIKLGQQTFQREIYVSLPVINYPLVAGLPAGVTESDAIRKVTVVVRWGSSVTEAVTSIAYLTNWRST